MRVGRTTAVALAVATLGLAPVGAADAGDGATEVDATGNPFTGGLGYAPEDVSVAVGAVVRWTNRDFLVPHTVTEAHELWDLAGSYGGTPVNPAGFGPGESVQRSFEAGTTAYYCRVHGAEAQHGTVAVPVALGTTTRTVKRRVSVRRRGRLIRRTIRRKITFVVARWAAQAPAAGQVFDVEARRGDGSWRPLRAGTVAMQARLRAGPRGSVIAVRARLRRADNPGDATGWSPDAAVVAP